MPSRTVRVRARPANAPALHPETFGEAPVGVVFPPGTTGFTKVTNPESKGPGHYLGFSVPPTAESASRRLVLPPSNRAEEVRTYRATGELYASIGTVAGSRTKDVQVEALNPGVLEEVSRRRLPYDIESRFAHGLAGAAGGGIAGLALGTAFGHPWLGLLLGLVFGFILGFVAPTDWGDLSSLLFGAADVNLLLTLA